MSDRERILARRAKFMLAALASVSVGVVACKDETKPQGVPNEVKRNNDAGVSSTQDEQPDASTPRQDAGPAPIPCLSVAYDPDAKPPPAPCLSPKPPLKSNPEY